MVWDIGPLHRLVYSIIQKEKDIDYNRLLKAVRSYSKDVCEHDLRNVLMKLEIWDKIDVVSVDEKQVKIILKQTGER